MSGLYIGQDYSSQIEKSNNIFSGNPGASGDGIHWPFDPNGGTPGFHINWNSPNADKEAKAAYEKLLVWLQNNPGHYNGYILLLRMTVDIGEHVGQYPNLAGFLSHQMTNGNANIFQLMVQAAYEGAAESQNSAQKGENAAAAFLNQLKNACAGLQGLPVIKEIYDSAEKGLSDLPNWVKTHSGVFKEAETGIPQFSWLDDNGRPITYSEFIHMAAFSVGIALTGDQSNAGGIINSLYQTEVEQLVAEFKGNPWALLAALMNLINKRDEDNGVAINGYGNNLNTLTEANGLVQKLLGDISGTNPNAAGFFTNLQKLRALVEQDPALQGLVTQLQSDVNTIDGRKIVFGPGEIKWTVNKGFYHFPKSMAGDRIWVNGHAYDIPANGEVYISTNNTKIEFSPNGGTGITLTFGQLAAMGATSTIGQEMGKWSSTVMSNFENGVTGMQTLLNGASPAIQQQIQAKTQRMQAEENFEKQAFSSLTTMNQQIMRMIQQVMG